MIQGLMKYEDTILRMLFIITIILIIILGIITR